MKSKLLVSLSTLFLFVLAGCGSSNKEGSGQTGTFKASAACIECHAVSKISPVTGVAIVTEWTRGAHNLKNGAACPDCHAVNGHPSSGVLPTIPGAAICGNCHTAVTMKTYSSHFNATTASYLGARDLATALKNPVMTGSFSACLGCHNPHDNSTLLPINEVYADSAHGAVKDDPFAEQAFAKNTASQCGRCHTGTGFRYFMTTGNQVVASKTILGVYSSSKETVGCNACHTDYSFQRLASDSRPANPQTGFAPPVFATFSTPYARPAGVSKNFPTNVGDTKLCIPCHAGRTGRTGASIAVSGSSATGPTDPHYFPVAGVMYMKIGFVNFTSLTTVIPAGTSAATTYGKTLLADTDITGGVTSTHRKLGTTAINGDSHNPAFFVPGNLDSGGPCVVCHMNDANGHSLQITGTTYNKVCINCHTSERGTPLNANNFLSAFVDENREQMNNALALGVKLLEQNYDITAQLLDLENPQEATWIKKSTGAAADFTKNAAGTTLTAIQQQRLRGAAFNIMAGYHENAAFVHARSSTRRLIYDALDWLDDGIINMSVGTTAQLPKWQSGPDAILDTAGQPAFAKGATAFSDSTLTALATGTTPSMTYLIGFSRTTGAWATPERP